MREGPSLGRNLAVLAGGEVAARLLTFVAFVHLARALQPAVYGLVEVALATMVFLTLGVEHGLVELGTREVARAPQRVESLASRVVSGQLLAALALYGLLWVVAVPIPIDPTVRRLLLLYGISLLGLPFALSWLFQGRRQMARVAALQVLDALVVATGVLLVIHEPAHVLRLPLVEIASVTVVGIAGVTWLRRSGERVHVSVHASRDVRLFRDGLPIWGSKMIWALRMYLPIMLLATFSGGAGVGLFGAAHRVMLVGQTMLNVYFTNIFPTISKLAYESVDELAHFIPRSVRLVVWPSVAAALAGTFLAPVVINLIFGGQYLRPEGSTSLAVLIWVIPVLAWRRHGRLTLIALNRQREELWCSLAGLTLLVPAAALLSAWYGPVGTAAAMVAAEFVAMTLTWWRLRKHVPTDHWLYAVLGLPSLAILSDRGEV